MNQQSKNAALTAREREVLECILLGLTAPEIAIRLNMAYKTAQCHREHIRKKYGVSSTATLISAVFRERLGYKSWAMHMASQVISDNPFREWATLLRKARDRFLTEAGLTHGAILKPRTGQFVGGLAHLINDCEAMRRDLDDLQRNNPELFEAFQQAIREP